MQIRDHALAMLEAALGYKFGNPDLLDEALTHPSAVGTPRRGGKAAASYQRLEFLGDRVLGLIVAELLVTRFPQESEGALARRFTDLVRQETLASVATSLNLGHHVRLPAVEEPSARSNPGLLGDLCEAVIAAIYLDGGLIAAHAFISQLWLPLITAQTIAPKDPKTALQEWAQKRAASLPRYRIVETAGPPHRPIFTVSVELKGQPALTGTGSSKRLAEIAAAAAMLATLGDQESTS